MNILVYDVAAEKGGALSVLSYFYGLHKLDTENHYYYILSTCHLEETDHITVVNVPQVKRGWLNRLYFDYVGVQKYLKSFQIDEVLSLQNTILPCFQGKQTVYEHNALPFADYRFRFSEDRMMWFYQNIIGKLMMRSIQKADHVIVQTEWMKQAIEDRVHGSNNKIEVRFPEVNILEGYRYAPQAHCTFFFPANASPFKNHRVILEAMMLLKNQGIRDYSVVFTLNGNENENVASLFELAKAENLAIQWAGYLTKEEVFAWYSKSVLLFPSYIETVGLPIYEALCVGSPAILADCVYARDVAAGFPNVDYHKYDDAETLAQLMKEKIEDGINRITQASTGTLQKKLVKNEEQ